MIIAIPVRAGSRTRQTKRVVRKLKFATQQQRQQFVGMKRMVAWLSQITTLLSVFAAVRCLLCAQEKEQKGVTTVLWGGTGREIILYVALGKLSPLTLCERKTGREREGSYMQSERYSGG